MRLCGNLCALVTELEERNIISRSVLDLKFGEKAVVVGFAEPNVACQLLTIGIIPDLPISLVRRAPFGGAVCLRLGETVVAVRSSEAKNILVK